MAFGSGDEGSVFPNSAQNVSNLVIDGHYILKRKKDTKESRAWQQFQIVLVSRRRRAAPFRIGRCETRIMFNPTNTEWRLKVFVVACCCVCKAYFTKESELPSTSVSLFNQVISGSNLSLTIRVSGSSRSVVLIQFQPWSQYITPPHKPQLDKLPGTCPKRWTDMPIMVREYPQRGM